MKPTSIHTKKILAFAATSSVLAALCLTGCQKNELSGDKDFNDGTIKYTIDMGRSVSSKGELVNTTGSDQELQTYGIEEFPASAYNGSTPVFENKAIKYTAGKWSTEDTYYWPQKTSLTFFAYANLPGEQTATINNTGVSTTHTVPATAAEQTDILFGYYNGNGGNTGTAEIHFEHPLTAVQFQRGEIDESLGIKSISLSGVAASGTAKMGLDGTISWNGVTDFGKTVSQEKSDGLTVTADIVGEPFILIPQNPAGNNVTVKVTFTDNVSVEAVIAAGEWLAGKTNTYKLNYVNGSLSANKPEMYNGSAFGDPEYVADLKWATENLAISPSGFKEYNGTGHINGDYFQWAAEFLALKNATYMEWDEGDKGVYVYTPAKGADAGKFNGGTGSYDKSNALLFFPLPGECDQNVSLGAVGQNGKYWARIHRDNKSSDAAMAYMFNISKTTISPNDGYFRQIG